VKTTFLWRNLVVVIVLVLMLAMVFPVKEASAAPAASDCHKVYYTIRCGDTLSGIAHKFGVNMWALAKMNGIKNPNRIYAGRTLVIRTDCCNDCKGKDYGKGGDYGYGHVYIVHRGDTLSSIAYRFHTSVWAIAKANHIRNINYIYAGQRLFIP
jgi:LysM repeat protein